MTIQNDVGTPASTGYKNTFNVCAYMTGQSLQVPQSAWGPQLVQATENTFSVSAYTSGQPLKVCSHRAIMLRSP